MNSTRDPDEQRIDAMEVLDTMREEQARQAWGARAACINCGEDKYLNPSGECWKCSREDRDV